MMSSQRRTTLLLGAVLLGFVVIAYSLFTVVAENRSLQTQVAILKQAQGESQGAQQSRQPIRSVPADTIPGLRADDHIEGSRSADLLLIEYSDYECPFCQQLHGTLQSLQTEFGEKLAVVYRQYPLPIHQGADMKSLIGECVASTAGEEAFWRYTHSMFTDAFLTERPEVLDRALRMGAERASLETCITQGDAQRRVNRDKQEGTKAGITGTPASFIIEKSGAVTAVSGALSLDAFRSLLTGLLP